MKILAAFLLLCSGYMGAQQINPNQIQPSSTPGQVLTTVSGTPNKAAWQNPTGGATSGQGTAPILVNGDSGTPHTGALTVSCPTCNAPQVILPTLSGTPPAGQYAIIQGGSCGVGSGNMSASCSNTGAGFGLPERNSFTFGNSADVFNYSLPAGIDPANVTGFYVYSALSHTPLIVFGGTATYTGGGPFGLTGGYQALTGLTAANLGTLDFNFGATSSAQAYAVSASASVLVLVYYTGSPINDSSINVQFPLQYTSSSKTMYLASNFDYAQDFGTADAYQAILPILAPPAAPFSPQLGDQVVLFVQNANLTTAPTLAITNAWDTVAHPIIGQSGSALTAGQLTPNNPAFLIFDGFNWRLQGGGTGGGGSGTVSGQANGVVPLATASTVIGAQSHINENTSGTTTVTQPLVVNDGSGNAGAITYTFGTAPGSATGGVKMAGPTSGTAYRIILPGTHPTGSNNLLSCTSADPAICTWAAGGGGSGVSSLNSLTGALSLTSSDSSVTITPSGSTIDLQAVGGGGAGGTYPANSNIVILGTSQLGVTSTCINQTLGPTQITASSVTAGVGTFTVTQSLIAGNILTLSGFSGAGLPLNGQQVTVLSSGLSGTQFEANVTGITTATTGAGVLGCSYLAATDLLMSSHLPSSSSVYLFSPGDASVASLITTYNTYIHSLSPTVTGKGGVIFIEGGDEEVFSAPNQVTLAESGLQQLWQLARGDGFTVVGMNLFDGSFPLDNDNVGVDIFAVNKWMGGQLLQAFPTGVSPNSNPCLGCDIDALIDVHGEFPNTADAGLYNGNHLTASGNKLLFDKMNDALLTLTSKAATYTYCDQQNDYGCSHTENNWAGIQHNYAGLNGDLGATCAQDFAGNNDTMQACLFANQRGGTFYPYLFMLNHGASRGYYVLGTHEASSGVNNIYTQGFESYCWNDQTSDSGNEQSNPDTCLWRDSTLGPGWVDFGSATRDDHSTGGIQTAAIAIGTAHVAGHVFDCSGTGCPSSGSGGLNGTVTYTSAHTVDSSDNGKLIIMNCSGACALTLPGTQPSTTWQAWVQSIGSTTATITLGGGDTYNAGSTAPTLLKFDVLALWADSATSTNYEGGIPDSAGSNVTITPSAHNKSIASTGGGSGPSSIVAGTNVTITEGSPCTTGTCTVNASGGGSSNAGHITVIPDSYTSLTGSWALSAVGGSQTYFPYVMDDSTNGDAITYSADLAPGTYTLLLEGITNSDHGKVDVSFNGTVIGTIDQYTSSINWRARQEITGIVVTPGGITSIALTINGKNASSSGFGLSFAYIALWRTS